MLANYDLRRAFSASVIAPSTTGLTASGNSGAVDTLPANGPLNFDLNVGTVTGTTPSATFQVQESDDGATGWTNVVGPNDGAPNSQVVTATGRYQIFCATAKKRYVRLGYTITGTTPVFPTSAVLFADARTSGTGGGSSVSPQT